MDSDETDLRGHVFDGVDLTGAVFRECVLDGARFVGCGVDDVSISPFAGRMSGLVVEGVDVTPYVEGELDRAYPERPLVRAAQTVDDLRTAWSEVCSGWDATLARAAALPRDLLDERVAGEWAFLETLRHLIAATDIWATRMLLGSEEPFHPLGLLHTDAPPEASTALGLDPELRPAYDAVVAAFLDRRALIDRRLTDLVEEQLDDDRTGYPTPAYGPETRSVRRCLLTVLREHVEHRRYAERDLAILSDR